MKIKIKPKSTIQHWLNQKSSSYVQHIRQKNFIPMHLGECTLIPAEKNIITSKDISAIHRYPKQSEDLKEKFAELFHVKKTMVSLGSGSDELIQRIPQLFLNPGDAVVIIVPTFFRFIDASRRAGANISLIKTKRKDNFEINEEIVAKLLTIIRKKKVKLVWLCSPNNPTGIPIKQSLIEKIASESSVLVVLDQIYGEFQESPMLSVKEAVEKFPNMIILKSMSKIFGLAGIRVGCAIANEKIIEILEKERLPFPISALSEIIALHILEKEKLIPSKLKALLKKERAFLFMNLRKIPNIDLVQGSQTNLFLIRHKIKNLFENLLQRGILVADMNHAEGIQGMRFVRVSVGTREQNRRLLRALSEIANPPSHLRNS